MLGERFGSYKAVAPLGAGSMGEVFLAEHQRIIRRAAIKVLKAQLMQHPDAVRAFFNEASATSSIRHPGIVEIFDCDVHRHGRAYIVMELLEGETLRARLERAGSVPWRMACDIARQAADAMAAVHAAGIVHRDLKPENLFLVAPAGMFERAKVKVLDFGVARLLSGDTTGAPPLRANIPLGSPAYMSPEQCGGSPPDHRADIYSLGCTLFEMVSGLPPFGNGRARDLMMAHRFRPAPPLAWVAPGAPAWLENLVARMLAKDPNDRPAAMAEVAAALERAEPRGGRPASAAVRRRRGRASLAGRMLVGGAIAVTAAIAAVAVHRGWTMGQPVAAADRPPPRAARVAGCPAVLVPATISRQIGPADSPSPSSRVDRPPRTSRLW